MSKKIIAKNKRASYDYQLTERYEAGLVLQGTEVKSLREGKAKIADSFISIDKNEQAWLNNSHIPPYAFGNRANHAETRKRKLLLSKKQIQDIAHEAQAKGLAIVPTILYFKNSLVKIEIALGKGKKLFDKRQDQAKKDAERKMRQHQQF